MNMPISEQLAQITVSIYSANNSLLSASSYAALQIKVNHEPAIKRAAYLGKTVASTTQAVTHSLVAAGLSGAKGLTEASLAASGLSFLCALPSAIETIQGLGIADKPKHSVKDIYLNAKAQHNEALKRLKISLLVTKPEKHDNILRLLYNLPLEVVQDKAHHNLFPIINKKLVRQKRGDAIRFFEKHLNTEEKRLELIKGFLNSLKNIDKENMERPPISLGEIATFLSLLDPEKDEDAINAFSQLFSELLIPFRQTLAKDIDCAAALDESNHALCHLMTATFTRRAHRKKRTAKQLNAAKHVLTGVGIVLSGALAVYSAGLSVPVTALLLTKIASSSVSLASTGVRIAKMIKEGAAINDIENLLTPEIIDELQKNNMGEELLKAALESVNAYEKELKTISTKIKTLAAETHDTASALKKDPLFVLKYLEANKQLAHLLIDEPFLESISNKINDGLDAPKLYQAMILEVEQQQHLSSKPNFAYQSAKLKCLEVITYYMLHEDEVTRNTFISMVEKGELATFIKGTFEQSRERAEHMYKEVFRYERQFTTLSSLSEAVYNESRLIHIQDHRLCQQKVGQLSIEKLLRASDHLEIIETSKEKLSETLNKAKEKIDANDANTNYHRAMKRPVV